ncbi:TetR family transcriptional regulator [Arthrobacter sp. TMN-50]
MTSLKIGALLDATEAESASNGIETESLRKIMREAGADPGAVNYHFGGRQELAGAVLDRIPVSLNARRPDLLSQAAANGQPMMSQLVECLIRPDIETAHALHRQLPGRARLIGAIYTRPSDFAAAKVAAHFSPVGEAYRPHIEAALPHRPFADSAWRIRWCVFGTVGSLLNDKTAAFERPADDLINELVETLAAALAI